MKRLLMATVMAMSLVAHAQRSADVDVKSAWARPTVAGQTGTGAFMHLTSRDGARLVGASSDVAGVVEIHEMAMEGNVMRMRPIRSLDLPPGSTVELKPGGKFEVLFMPTAPKGQQGADDCTVLSFIPNQMISHTWNAPSKFAHARANHTWVVVHFDELAPTRTRIRLDHLGFAEKAAEFPDHRAEYEQVRAYFQQAWGKVLDAIKLKGTAG